MEESSKQEQSSSIALGNDRLMIARELLIRSTTCRRIDLRIMIISQAQRKEGFRAFGKN